MSIYGFIIGVCFVIGIEYFSKKNNIIPKNKENLFFILLLIFSIIGARIYSVISDWNYYSQNLPQVFNTRGGGLGIFGGLIFGLVYIFIYSRINKLSFLKILNIIAPIVPLGQSIGRWGNFFNHEIYSLNGQPVWLYESILDFLLFLFLIKRKSNQTAYYLIGYGIIRFFLEFLRWDTWQINNLKIGQLISILFMISGLILIKKSYFKQTVI